MLHRNVTFVSLFMLSMAFMAVMEAALPPKVVRKSDCPDHYRRFGYTRPLPPSLQASFNGDLSNWSDVRIQNALNDCHQESGDTLLHVAANSKVVQKILSIPEGMNLLFARNRAGNLPIHQCAFRQNVSLLQALLDGAQAQGALVPCMNARNSSHRDTSAHIAVAWGKWKTLEILAAYGADLTLRNKQRETPEDIVRRISCSECNPKGLSMDAYYQSVSNRLSHHDQELVHHQYFVVEDVPTRFESQSTNVNVAPAAVRVVQLVPVSFAYVPNR